MSAQYGNEVRGVTRATRGAATPVAALVGPLTVLISYGLIKSGFETDAEQANLVAGAFGALIGGLATWFAATYAGKRTPSDPAEPQVPLPVDMPEPDSIPTQGVAGDATSDPLPASQPRA